MEKMPGRNPGELHTIIITHHHFDHTGGLPGAILLIVLNFVGITI